MTGNMAQVHMTEAELAQNLHAVLEKVRNGEEILVERDRRPFAVIRAPEEPGRSIDECIAIAKAYEERLGYAPLPDADFAADVQAAIDAHQEPLEPPAWEPNTREGLQYSAGENRRRSDSTDHGVGRQRIELEHGL